MTVKTKHKIFVIVVVHNITVTVKYNFYASKP